MRRATLVTIPVLLGGLAIACSSARQEVSDSQSSALWSVSPAGDVEPHSDVDDLRHNIVVSLAASAGGESRCTGVLVTPRLVLTAASCKNGAKVGSLPWVRIGGGGPAFDAGVPAFRTVVRAQSFVTWAADPAQEPSLSSHDVGLITLPSYVLTDALVRHPSFKAPTPAVPTPSPGGQYRYQNIGMAGFSPRWLDNVNRPPAVDRRQARVETELLLWSYGSFGPNNEPFWIYKPFSDNGDAKFGLAAGDNGSPLFAQTATGEWDTFGVASIVGDPPDEAVRAQSLPGLATQCAPVDTNNGSVTSCDAWVDITASSVREWIRVAALDPSRGAKWLQTHPRPASSGLTDGEWWIGDVDYTGPCDSARDADCDHIWDKNGDNTPRDNCPSLANTDQRDSDDDGHGDACPCQPTTCAQAQKNCGAIANGCGGTIDCGTCTAPYEGCGRGGSANVCGCTPRSREDACAGTCGTRSNWCGGTYFCGKCNGKGGTCPEPDCKPVSWGCLCT